MPVLRLNGADMPVTLYFDPSVPLDPQRSWVDLAPADAPSYAMSAGFATTLGYATSLTPSRSLAAARSGRLAFCKSPIYAIGGENAGSEVFHLAPDGAFLAGVQVPESVQALRAQPTAAGQTADQDEWMFGDSGAEYALLDTSSGDCLVFSAGCPAYIPGTSATTALSPTATTAYMTLLPGTAAALGLPYYAQPLEASLFTGSSDLGDGFLDFLPLLSGRLPTQAQVADLAPVVFPAGVYRWLASADIDLARSIEAAVFAPTRRAVIGGITLQDSPPDTQPDHLAVTPQGLVAELSQDKTEMAGVLFANLPASKQVLSFTPVK